MSEPKKIVKMCEFADELEDAYDSYMADGRMDPAEDAAFRRKLRGNVVLVDGTRAAMQCAFALMTHGVTAKTTRRVTEEFRDQQHATIAVFPAIGGPEAA